MIGIGIGKIGFRIGMIGIWMTRIRINGIGIKMV